jgi:hypothetical protein
MYATGRPVEASDMPTVRSLVRQAADDDYRFSTLIKGIVNTTQFRFALVPGLDDDQLNLVAENQ